MSYVTPLCLSVWSRSASLRFARSLQSWPRLLSGCINELFLTRLMGTIAFVVFNRNADLNSETTEEGMWEFFMFFVTHFKSRL